VYQETYTKYPTENMAYLRAGYVTSELARVDAALPGKATVLDFGYGTGTFLHKMAQAGHMAYGLDLHGQDYGVTDWKIGVDAVPDVVTAFDSLEHLSDFDSFFGLRPQIYIISTPWRPTWFGRHYKRWRHYKPGEHLHYFSPRSLRVLFARHGYAQLSLACPEDIVRGRLEFEGVHYPNIMVGVFVREC
jgi:hypothetical protein